MPTITILHYFLSLSSPYKEGQAMSATEATLLNALRAENIQKRGERQLRKHMGKRYGANGSDGTLSREELESFRGFIRELDRTYQFPVKAAIADGGQVPFPIPKPGTFESECRTIAIERVEMQARAAGARPTVEQWEDAIIILMDDEAVQQEARKRFADRMELNRKAIEELF